ncbi:MAG: nucleoside monophosphate kinase [Nanoarchaeota archaeon]
MSLMRLLFVGIPGAGKSTQAKLLVPYGFRHISTGELIRESWKREDELTMPYKDRIESGGFLPDREIFLLIEKEIASLKDERGYVLDGAVRNITQTETALKMGLIGKVLRFYLSEEKAAERLIKRLEMQGRKDDSLKVIKRRIKTYKRFTAPIIPNMERKKVPIISLDASLSVGEIHYGILEILKLK